MMTKAQFAERLTEIMEEKNRTARDVSLSIGKGSGYINSIQNKKAYPSMKLFFMICEELNITPVDFFDTETRYPEMMNRVAPYFKKMNKEEFETVENLLSAIVKKHQ